MNGEGLRGWRAQHGYSQLGLAREFGIDRQTILNREKSTDEIPRLWELALIALKDENNKKIGGDPRPAGRQRKIISKR